jgi:FkbM family methyltransferase
MALDGIIGKLGRSVRRRGILATSLLALRTVNPFSPGSTDEKLDRARRLERQERRQWIQSQLQLLQSEADSTGCIERIIHGSKMRLDVRPSSNQTLEHDLAIDGTREPRSTEYYKGVLLTLKADWASLPPPLVLDIGANVGYFALLQANLMSGFAKVIAVEADPENAERLKHNIALNGYGNIEVLNSAAGAAPGVGALARGKSANVHKMADISEGSTDLQPVEVVTIDQLVASHAENQGSPVIVRMDIEGYEGHAFEGMKVLLASDRPCYLFFELHESASEWFERIAEHLRAGRFTVERIAPSKGDGISVQAGDYDRIKSLASLSHVFCRR